MPHEPEDAAAPKSAVAVVPKPTQGLGIREAQADTHPKDPTRRVHPDSVPLSGAPQPSRRDQVMPTAEPVVPDEDAKPGSADHAGEGGGRPAAPPSR